MQSLKLKKAKFIKGKNLFLRNANSSDALFIFSLRTDTNRNAHISGVSNDPNDQKKWLECYKTDTDQAYFIICDTAGTSLGTIRIYNTDISSFCWGSWLLLDNLPPTYAIESVLLMYAYCLALGFDYARIDVRKGNERVWRFHEKFFSAEKVSESLEEYHYVVNNENIKKCLLKYRSFLTFPLEFTLET